jgi:DNA replication protein DnaC
VLFNRTRAKLSLRLRYRSGKVRLISDELRLTAGDEWLASGANLLMFGPPGGGKSHLAATVGLALVENGWRVLFMRTTDLVQRLQVAWQELALENAITKLDKYDLLVLDDLAYVS